MNSKEMRMRSRSRDGVRIWTRIRIRLGSRLRIGIRLRIRNTIRSGIRIRNRNRITIRIKIIIETITSIRIRTRIRMRTRARIRVRVIIRIIFMEKAGRRRLQQVGVFWVNFSGFRVFGRVSGTRGKSRPPGGTASESSKAVCLQERMRGTIAKTIGNEGFPETPLCFRRTVSFGLDQGTHFPRTGLGPDFETVRLD